MIYGLSGKNRSRSLTNFIFLSSPVRCRSDKKENENRKNIRFPERLLWYGCLLWRHKTGACCKLFCEWNWKLSQENPQERGLCTSDKCLLIHFLYAIFRWFNPSRLLQHEEFVSADISSYERKDKNHRRKQIHPLLIRLRIALLCTVGTQCLPKKRYRNHRAKQSVAPKYCIGKGQRKYWSNLQNHSKEPEIPLFFIRSVILFVMP